MTAATPERILKHLRRHAGLPDTTLSDGDLLRRYLTLRDQTAFAVLVRRHGALVLGVARSVLRQTADAEDTFQATFLILARKGNTIRHQEGLGGWLQSVAYRVALKVRANAARRQAREAQAAPAAATRSAGDDLTWGELRLILHAELATLPERFREPLILCYLEGLTQDEAAQRLSLTTGTLKGRLQRGRDMLRRRLLRRGVSLTAVLGAALTSQALEMVSAALLEKTLRAAGPGSPGAQTAATALARTVLSSTLPARRALLAGVLLLAGLVVGGVGLLSPGSGSEGTAAPVKPDKELQPKTDLHGDPLPEGALARLGSLRLRHSGLSDFLPLPDGKTLLSAGGEVVRIWELASGRLLRTVRLQGPAASADRGAVAQDGKMVVKLHNNTFVFWEVDSGKEIKNLPVGKEEWSQYYFSPDGNTLIALTWKPQLILWDWKNGKDRKITLPHRRIGRDSTFHSCVSPDGKYLAAGGGAGQLLCVYDFATGRELYRLSCHASASTFTPDSKRLVVSGMYNDKGGQEAVIRVFELATGKQAVQFPLGHDYSYFSLGFSGDGKTLACAFSDRSCLLDITTGRVLHRLADRPIVAAFSQDGKTLIANMGHRFRLWDVTTGKVLQDRPGDFGWMPVLAISPDGKLLAEADWLDQSVSLWDTGSGRLLRLLPLTQGRQRRYVRTLTFSADGKSLISGQMEGFLQWWDVATGKVQRTLQLTDPGRPNKDWIYFYQVQASRDGKRVMSLEQYFDGKETTRLASWDAETGKLLHQQSLPGKVVGWAWSGGSLMVALPTPEGVKVMDVETGAVRVRIPGTVASGPLLASPDNRLLAAPLSGTARPGDKGTIGVWERATGKEVARVAAGTTTHLALAADSRHLITAHEKLLCAWDIATGKERRRWPLPEAITRLRLSPDGRRAITALADGTALVWDLTPALGSGGKAGKLDETKLATCWKELASSDARRAYAAIWELAAAPAAAVPFLRRQLQPPAEAAVKAVRQRIDDLDSPRFATREQAFEWLSKQGETAEPVLRHALEKKPSLEVRRRIQRLLEKHAQRPPSAAVLRMQRALAVLEQAGAEGRALLRELAAGSADTRLAHQAREALQRLSAPQ
jgi:RNA polymerase sigma factor (sigma-70 family)